MKKVKVYYARPSFGTPTLCLNPGEAKDVDLGYVEGEMIFDGNIEDFYDKPLYSHKIYDPKEGLLHSTWCVNEEQAAKMAAKEQFADAPEVTPEELISELIVAILQRPFLKPMEFPIPVTLYQGDKGLFCRLTPHPERDGTRSRGKIFFPDRNCTEELRPGPILVTEVKEFENYGFFKGKMRKFSMPSDEDLDTYIERRFENEEISGEFRFVSGAYGDYVVTSADTIIARDENGNTVYNFTYETLGREGTVTKTVSYVDFICEGYHDCTFDELLQKFEKFAFEDAFDVWSCDKFISEILDDAFADGFILPKTLEGIFFVSVNSKTLIKALMNYSREEMKEIIETVNSINQKANEAIKSKIKNGKISLERLKAPRRRHYWD